MKLQLNEHIKPNSNSQRREKWTTIFVKKTKEMEITGNQCDIKRCIMMLVILFISSSSFTTENLQLDEGYFPAHAWHDNFFLY